MLDLEPDGEHVFWEQQVADPVHLKPPLHRLLGWDGGEEPDRDCDLLSVPFLPYKVKRFLKVHKISHHLPREAENLYFKTTRYEKFAIFGHKMWLI